MIFILIIAKKIHIAVYHSLQLIRSFYQIIDLIKSQLYIYIYYIYKYVISNELHELKATSHICLFFILMLVSSSDTLIINAYMILY